MKSKNFYLPHALLFFILSITLFGKAHSQAIIHFHSGEIMHADIISEDENDITIKAFSDTTDKTLILDKAQIASITLESGIEIKVNDQPQKIFLEDPFKVYLPYDNEIALNTLSLFNNFIEVRYERRIKDYSGIEASFGVIGFDWHYRGRGWSYDYTDSHILPTGEEVRIGSKYSHSGDKGFLFRIGPKLMFSKKNSMSGLYLKPEFFYHRIVANGSHYFYDYYSPETNFDYSWKYKGGSIGLMVKLGLQKVILKRISIDYNFGVGFAHDFEELITEGELPPVDQFANIGYPKYNQAFNYTNQRFDFLGIRGAFSHELSIGFLF